MREAQGVAAAGSATAAFSCCENLTALCTDDTVDQLIRCIEGWLTTHCSCTLASVAPPKPAIKYPVSGLQWAAVKLAR